MKQIYSIYHRNMFMRDSKYQGIHGAENTKNPEKDQLIWGPGFSFLFQVFVADFAKSGVSSSRFRIETPF